MQKGILGASHKLVTSLILDDVQKGIVQILDHEAHKIVKMDQLGH